MKLRYNHNRMIEVYNDRCTTFYTTWQLLQTGIAKDEQIARAILAPGQFITTEDDRMLPTRPTKRAAV